MLTSISGKCHEHFSLILSAHQIEHAFCFLLSVISPIDKKRMDGVPSIRVHHALDYANSNHIIRWTEVFILKVSESHIKSHIPTIIIIICSAYLSFILVGR